jgi:hypothetical protein
MRIWQSIQSDDAHRNMNFSSEVYKARSFAWHVDVLWGCLSWSFSINRDFLASLGGDNHNVVLDRHHCGLDEALCVQQQ